MSNIITARDPGIIAAEINYIKERTKKSVKNALEIVKKVMDEAEIEIGGKLCEVKSMVPHGEWGAWLLENVEYSQSTAENLMKIYREYGDGQARIGDTWRNSETFGKLTFTQHLELLKIPYEERQEFAEENNVAEMSTRELQKAIKERDEETHRREQAEQDLEFTQAQLRDAEQHVIDMEQKLSAAKSSEGAWEQEIKNLTAEKHLAETGEKNAVKKVEVLENQLKDARAKEKAIRADLKKAQEHPEIPESMMEQLRKEAEAAAAQQATTDIQKQLNAANAALANAEAKAKEAEARLEEAQKNQKMNDQDLMAVQTLGQQMLTMANSINGHRLKAVMKDENNAKAINGFLTYILNELRVSFGIKKDALGGS